MPVVLFGKAFWDKVLNLEALCEQGVISPKDLDLFRFVETAAEAWDCVRCFYETN